MGDVDARFIRAPGVDDAPPLRNGVVALAPPLRLRVRPEVLGHRRGRGRVPAAQLADEAPVRRRLRPGLEEARRVGVVHIIYRRHAEAAVEPLRRECMWRQGGLVRGALDTDL